MASEKSDLTRASTMELTAEDGKQYLDKNLTDWKKPLLMNQFNKDKEEDEDDTEEEAASDSKPGKKRKLSKDNTMKDTAKDGKLFLEKNLTTWKKKYMMSHFNDTEDNSEKEATESKHAKKPKLAKHTTMKGTAKEAAALLASGGPDEDVFTRGQQKALDVIKNEKPKAKKRKLARDSTMVATAKEGQALIGKGKIGGTHRKKKTNMKRSSTMTAVVAEAEEIYGSIDSSSTRKLRKQSHKPPGLKKVGTMEKTAKEGKAFLRRKQKRSRK